MFILLFPTIFSYQQQSTDFSQQSHTADCLHLWNNLLYKYVNCQFAPNWFHIHYFMEQLDNESSDNSYLVPTSRILPAYTISMKDIFSLYCSCEYSADFSADSADFSAKFPKWIWIFENSVRGCVTIIRPNRPEIKNETYASMR